MENYDEYLTNHEDTLVQIDSVYVDFGASLTIQSLDQQVQEKSISIFNKTKSKIVLYWNFSEKQSFKISPQTCEIPAMKSCSFRIKFEPVRLFIEKKGTQSQFLKFKFKLRKYRINFTNVN